MTNKKNTGRALLASVLALVMCVSMLVGSTYAWFTDSVSSVNNVIKSGNLDMVLSWKPYGAENTDWTEVDADTVIFGEDALFEPGYTEAAWLKIENVGSLAFKYNVAINVIDEKSSTNVYGEEFKLSDYLVVRALTTTSVSMEENFYTTRDSLDSFAWGNAGSVDTKFAESVALTGTGVAFPAGESNSDAYVLVVIQMPESVGNDANHLTSVAAPEITFGITALATQVPYEEDSFGNDYDVSASFDDAIFAHGGIINLEADTDKAASIGAGASVTINTNGYAVNAPIYNNGDLTLNDGSVNYAGAGFQNVGTATVNGVTMNTGDAYNYANITRGDGAETVYNDAVINAGGGAVAAADGASVVFNSGSAYVDSASTSGRYIFYAEGADSVITINGGSFSWDPKDNQKRAYICAIDGATVYVNGGTFGKASTRSGYTAGIITQSGGTVVITGGTFGFDPSAWVAPGYEATKNGTTWTVEPAIKDNADLADAIANGETNVILGAGTFNMPAAAKGKTLSITGVEGTIIEIVPAGQGEAGGQLDYNLDGSNVTFNNVTIKTNNKTYAGYARLSATYNDCTFENQYCLNGTSEFNNCTFNVSGDVYNVWTWGAPVATFNDCTFNNDGKALLLYGTANTTLTVNDCVFNDNGGLTALKAAIEIGNDYNKSYNLIVNNTVVNGYEINDAGINTGTTLWANKNSMSTEKLNVVVDGVDVY